MLTHSPSCSGGASNTISSNEQQKKAKLACNRCRIRKQSCDKKLPNCSRCFKDNAACCYNWKNKTTENTVVKQKPSKFHFKVFALKTYNDSFFLSLQRSEILNFNNNIKQSTFYHLPSIICNSKLSDLFDMVIRGNDLYFVDLNKGYLNKSKPLSPVSQASSPDNDLVKDLISDTTIWVELLNLYLKECFPFNSFFNLNTFHTKSVSSLLLNTIYWAGYQYKIDKYPKLTKYLDNLASNSLKAAIRTPSVSNIQTLMLGMFVRMYRGEFEKSRALLSHATRMSTLLGFHENLKLKNLLMIQQIHTVRSQIVIFNTVMRLYCQRPCYFIPDPLGMTKCGPWIHVMGSSIGEQVSDFEIVRGHCIYYLTQYFDDIFVDILFHLSECTSKKSPLVDRPKYQQRLDNMFQAITYRYCSLIQYYSQYCSYIQPFLNYCTFKYYFYSFRLYDYEISTSIHMNKTCLESLSITLEKMTHHYTTIPETLKLIMRNLVQGVGLTMLRVTERVPPDHQKQYLSIVKEIKTVCGPDEGLDLLSIGLQQLSIN